MDEQPYMELNLYDLDLKRHSDVINELIKLTKEHFDLQQIQAGAQVIKDKAAFIVFKNTLFQTPGDSLLLTFLNGTIYANKPLENITDELRNKYLPLLKSVLSGSGYVTEAEQAKFDQIITDILGNVIDTKKLLTYNGPAPANEEEYWHRIFFKDNNTTIAWLRLDNDKYVVWVPNSTQTYANDEHHLDSLEQLYGYAEAFQDYAKKHCTSQSWAAK